jgi:hypothetical protein
MEFFAGKKSREMQELEREERKLQMELLDVLTDITTPESSDVEGEDVEELLMPAARQALLDTRTCPIRWTLYSELYQSRSYREKAAKKVRMAKRMIKKVTVAEVMMTQQFTAALNQIELNYPDDGGRTGLNSLVACHHVIKPCN